MMRSTLFCQTAWRRLHQEELQRNNGLNQCRELRSQDQWLCRGVGMTSACSNDDNQVQSWLSRLSHDNGGGGGRSSGQSERSEPFDEPQ
mmetsp:Transcript_31713/g.67562  ORF Transcript_31713/g.67562 Transcript_31713/m.67562 type:complete len:89 (+) Transcript_31713:277-543(+)